MKLCEAVFLRIAMSTVPVGVGAVGIVVEFAILLLTFTI